MNALIKSATIIDSKSTHHGKTLDVRVKNGTIVEIGTNLEAAKGEKRIKEVT